jgi:Nucleotide modification associated domain 1
MDAKTYLDLIRPAMEIVVKKHEDYNTGIALRDYFPFGDKSYIQMLHTKVLRLRSLEGREANFEGLDDTLKDLINYSVFYLQYLQEQKNEQP